MAQFVMYRQGGSRGGFEQSMEVLTAKNQNDLLFKIYEMEGFEVDDDVDIEQVLLDYSEEVLIMVINTKTKETWSNCDHEE